MYRPHWYNWKTYQLSKPFDKRFSDNRDNPCNVRHPVENKFINHGGKYANYDQLSFYQGPNDLTPLRQSQILRIYKRKV